MSIKTKERNKNESWQLGILTIAGVQEFISESRKLADLHESSQIVNRSVGEFIKLLNQDSSLINELMKNTITNIANLITDVQFIIPPFDNKEYIDKSYPNQLLFKFKNGTNPSEIETQLRKSIADYFEKLGADGFKIFSTKIELSKNEKGDLKAFETLWRQQWRDSLPIFFVSLPKNNNDFKELHQKLQKKLIAHKLNRRFQQWSGAPVEKCIQCGHREVFGPQDNVDHNKQFWQSNKIILQLLKTPLLRKHERLCTVCLGKRLLKKEKAFPSTAAVALGPFFRDLVTEWEKDKKAISEAWNNFEDFLTSVFNPLLSNELKYRNVSFEEIKKFVAQSTEYNIPGKISDNAEWYYKDFYYKDTWKNLVEEDKFPNDETLSKAREKLANLYDLVGVDPSPYLAVIEYDGDKMGEKLGKLEETSLKKISKQISHLANVEIKNIVRKSENMGVLIYSGGEDVLAFAPIKTALKIIDEINHSFRKSLNNKIKSDISFTGSGSITFFRYNFSLRKALEISKESLHIAKDRFNRDSLTITGILPDTTNYVCGSKWDWQKSEVSFSYWFENTLNLFNQTDRQVSLRDEDYLVKLTRQFIFHLMEVIPAFFEKQSDDTWEVDKEPFKLELKRMVKRYIKIDNNDLNNKQKDDIASLIINQMHQFVDDFCKRDFNAILLQEKGMLNPAALFKIIDYHIVRG